MPVATGERPGAVEIDFDLDVGFLGLALHGGFAHGDDSLEFARLLSGVCRDSPLRVASGLQTPPAMPR